MPEKEQVSEIQWHIDEFADVELKDARLNRRCAELAGQLDMNPEGPINQACEDWADTKAAGIDLRRDRVSMTGSGSRYISSRNSGQG